MFFYGIHEVKKRVIEYLQDTVGKRPLFERVQIFNRFPKDWERDKINIVVSGSSKEHIQLSPDNFMQTDFGYVSQARVDDHPGYFLSWAVDDLSSTEVIENRVESGLYFLTLNNVTATGATLQIDCLGVQKNETVLFNYTGESVLQLEHYPVLPETFQLFVDGSMYPPDPPANYYDLNATTGAVTLNREPAIGAAVRASYNWVKASLPDVDIEKGIARSDILTGVLMAFNEEFVEGDRAIIVVGDTWEPSSLTFGGRMGVTLSFDTRSQDTPTSERVVDILSETLWGRAKPDLRDEGLDITSVSVGGESEAPEDETGQEWAFQFALTAAVEAEWQTRVPLLRRYSWGIVNLPLDVDIFSATDEELIQATLRFLEEPIGPQLSVASFP